jgi:hypothetical protein
MVKLPPRRYELLSLEELRAEFDKAIQDSTELHKAIMEGHYTPKRQARVYGLEPRK